MKTTKRLLSALMAMLMVSTSAVIVSAEGETENENEIAAVAPTAAVTQKVTGTGADEGFVQMKLLRVVLPTDSLGYKVDAQGLVKKSFLSGEAGKQHYGDAYTVVYSTKDAEKDVTAAKTAATDDNHVLDDGFVFFEYTDAKTQKQTLSNHMDLVVKNKGTFDVNITPDITFKKGSGSNPLDALIWTNDLGTGDTAKGLVFNLYEKKSEDGKISYEKLKENSTDTARALQIPNVKDLYKTTYERDGETEGYKYALDEETYASKEAKLDNKVTFTIEAFSNPEKVTKAVTDSGSGSIELVWRVEEAVTATP
jgi:hypothetical protein